MTLTKVRMVGDWNLVFKWEYLSDKERRASRFDLSQVSKLGFVGSWSSSESESDKKV